MERMNDVEYDFAQEYGNVSTKSRKKQVRFLKKVVADEHRTIKKLLKNPNKKVASYNAEDNMYEPSTNRDEAKVHKRVFRRALKMLREFDKEKSEEKRDQDTKRRRKSLLKRKVSGGGGMMTTFKKGKSLIEKMKDL